ncbi:malonate--CoA ligase [Oleisolibacter albus]|uniref:malonate--CoA ligase n=1 Tax=Oleisolibacter albus TaxID=2171757 RepID=UPI000DF14F22|nr:malonyl-CoA synthase [Oleisolibacter albus]
MAPLPASENLYHLFESRFPADRSRPFLETDEGQVWSYTDLEAVSARYARALAGLGVRKGDRVAVQVEKSPENLFLYLAVLRAGAIYLPLNTAYQRGEIGYFLEDAEPTLFVCRPENAAEMRELATRCRVPHLLTLGMRGTGTLPELAAGQPDGFETVPMQREELAAILYTSGTTGRSKGAMTSHGNLASNALILHDLWGFRPGDVLLHALPIFHVHGLFVATNTTLLNGSSMLFCPKFDVDTVIRLLPRATVMMGVPTFYTRLLADPRFTRDLAAHMRLFISGSAPLLADTHKDFAARTGHAILERYGMTEAGMITSNPYAGERIPGTVGFPLPGVELRVADEQGRILGPEEIGVIEFRGPNLFKGYWRKPEKTAEDMRPDGFFITGDVGKVDARGYVHIVGRAKDLVICGGYNVYPKEIETVIDAIDGVVESAVIGLPHPDFGEAVAAVVQRKPGRPDVSEDGIIAQVKGELANFKVPKRVWFVDELPRNQMGKVQKALLREQHRDTFKPA